MKESQAKSGLFGTIASCVGSKSRRADRTERVSGKLYTGKTLDPIRQEGQMP